MGHDQKPATEVEVVGVDANDIGTLEYTITVEKESWWNDAIVCAWKTPEYLVDQMRDEGVAGEPMTEWTESLEYAFNNLNIRVGTEEEDDLPDSVRERVIELREEHREY